MEVNKLSLACRFTLIFCFGFLNLHVIGQTYELKQYLDNYKLDYLIKVESEKDKLTLYGYNNGYNSTMLTRVVKLKRYEVLGVSDWSFFFRKGHFSPIPISVTTVPFKVRPELEEFRANATSGISNLGLNVDLANWHLDRYFASGDKSTHKLYAGLWVAPSVEELDSVQTRGFLSGDAKSKQLFMSAALTINYSYNSLTFTFVPVGFDIATSSTGKTWIYNEKRWWGFGIGLQPKFLNPISNK